MTVYCKGPFTRTVSVKFYHCVNGDISFDRQNGFGTHSVHQCKFESDRDGTCKRTLIRKIPHSAISVRTYCVAYVTIKDTTDAMNSRTSHNKISPN